MFLNLSWNKGAGNTKVEGYGQIEQMSHNVILDCLDRRIKLYKRNEAYVKLVCGYRMNRIIVPLPKISSIIAKFYQVSYQKAPLFILWISLGCIDYE